MRMFSSSSLGSSTRYTWTTSSTAPRADPIACHRCSPSTMRSFSENCKRIVENKGVRFKREAVVPPLVDPVLFIVPLKPHRYTKCITRPKTAACPSRQNRSSGAASEWRVVRPDRVRRFPRRTSRELRTYPMESSGFLPENIFCRAFRAISSGLWKLTKEVPTFRFRVLFGSSYAGLGATKERSQATAIWEVSYALCPDVRPPGECLLPDSALGAGSRSGVSTARAFRAAAKSVSVTS